VCPSTVWRVVLGLKNENYPKVVPKGKDKVKSLTLAIYSHGDSHPAVKIIKHQHQHQHQEKKEADNAAAAAATENGSSNLMGPPDLKPHLDPLKHEWFVHMPYPNKDRVLTTQQPLPFRINYFVSFSILILLFIKEKHHHTNNNTKMNACLTAIIRGLTTKY